MKITLLDGSVKEYPQNTTAIEIANSISVKLAATCIGAKINGKLTDISEQVLSDCKLELITASKETPECLEIIRHSTAHLLAQTVKELFPNVQIGIGPVIENGFYYDFLTEKPFSSSDLKTIQTKMEEIAKKKYSIVKKVISRSEALLQAEKENEGLKHLIINDIPNNQEITTYSQGDFTDICRGVHVPNTSFLKHFQLIKVSGSYWRGNSKNQPLQRIYGVAWAKASSLQQYMTMLKEADLRDHRKLGQDLNLFHQQQEAPGDIFWHPNGYTIFITIQNYIRKMLSKLYQEVKTPQLLQRKLWEQSGHWSKFKSNMFTLSIDEANYAIKPMNCPGHVQIFKQNTRSYRDLPLRLAEFGCCHRWESSGSTHGIMRLRAFVQDDAHIFCEFDQILEEACTFIDLLFNVYKDFGFDSIMIKLSTRPKQREGSDESWDIAEKALINALEKMHIKYTINKGEGAFYGPKLEFVLKDAIGREWQCGTLQVDLVLPNKLDAKYIDKNGQKKCPVMLHRAILGSIERFIGILIEHYTGRFPFWLAPIQVVVCSLTSKQNDAVKDINKTLLENDIRSKIDTNTETINYKIRRHIGQKVPYIVVIGKREVSDKTVSLRKGDSDKTIIISVSEFLELLKNEERPQILM
ncbi:MAG: threonine--tRNA ligase [Alphaproteobacteria bacterium]|nr:threonine--tRNA ligase [Rickettsiales bacterium]